jgi:hypothetical protein
LAEASSRTAALLGWRISVRDFDFVRRPADVGKGSGEKTDVLNSGCQFGAARGIRTPDPIITNNLFYCDTARQ